jgi:hypothetical protein
VFASSVPPVAALYHAKEVSEPEALKLVVNPAATVAPGGFTEGAAGNGNTENVAALVAVPLGVVTLTVPVVPLPMVATIWEPLFDRMAVTGVPPILTLAAVAPVNAEPLMVIEVPVHPPEAPKLVMEGGGTV